MTNQFAKSQQVSITMTEQCYRLLKKYAIESGAKNLCSFIRDEIIIPYLNKRLEDGC